MYFIGSAFLFSSISIPLCTEADQLERKLYIQPQGVVIFCNPFLMTESDLELC